MEIKNCGRCGEKISCNAAENTPCACNQIQLLPDTLAFLKKTTYDCLCNQCLLYHNELVQKAITSPTAPLLENVHYYIENDFFVFTDLFLCQRGYCCKNGCRHCVFGFKRK
jgi:Family of unknown function (DUF5522)/Cysteine-rich CWC